MSEFTSDGARTRFRDRYERMIDRLWPADRQVDDLPTTFGPTRVYRVGPATGTAFVLLPGAGGNALMWHRHVAGLSHTHTVVAVDPVGEPGGSTQTRPVADGADLVQWLDDVLVAADVDRAHVVGCSYGGWIALLYAIQRPGRVASITLLDSAWFGRIGGTFMAWIIAGGLAALSPRPVRHRAARWLHNATLLDDDVMPLARLIARFRRRLPVPSPLSEVELASVGVPVLALFGEHSVMYDAAQVAARVAAHVPNCRAEVIPGASHDLAVYDPDLIVRRVQAFVESEVDEHR